MDGSRVNDGLNSKKLGKNNATTKITISNQTVVVRGHDYCEYYKCQGFRVLAVDFGVTVLYCMVAYSFPRVIINDKIAYS